MFVLFKYVQFIAYRFAWNNNNWISNIKLVEYNVQQYICNII